MKNLIKNSLRGNRFRLLQVFVLTFLIFLSFTSYSLFAHSGQAQQAAYNEILSNTRVHDVISASSFGSFLPQNQMPKKALDTAFYTENSPIPIKDKTRCGVIKQDDVMDLDRFCLNDFLYSGKNTDNPFETETDWNYSYRIVNTYSDDLKGLDYYFVNDPLWTDSKNPNRVSFKSPTELANPNSMDHVYLVEGEYPGEKTNLGDPNELSEVLISPYFAEQHDIEVGDELEVWTDKSFLVTGFAYVPDLMNYGGFSLNHPDRTWKDETFIIFNNASEFLPYSASPYKNGDNAKPNKSLFSHQNYTNGTEGGLNWGQKYGTVNGVDAEPAGKYYFEKGLSKKTSYLLFQSNSGETASSLSESLLNRSSVFLDRNKNPADSSSWFVPYDSDVGRSKGIGGAKTAIEINNIISLYLTIGMMSIAGIVLVVIILRVLQDNHRQYGVLKASGYRNWRIAFSFISYALIPSFIGGVLGFFGGYFGQRYITHNNLASFQMPISYSYTNVAIVLVSIFAPFMIMGFFAFLIGVIKLRKNTIKLIYADSSEKNTKWASKISLFLQKKNVPFQLRIRSAFLTKAPFRTLFVFVCVLFSGFLLTITFGIGSSIGNLIEYSFGNINYNYSYTLNEDLLFNQDSTTNPVLRTNTITKAKDAATKPDGLQSTADILTALSAGSKGLENEWIACGVINSKKCWFEETKPADTDIDKAVKNFVANIFPREVNEKDSLETHYNHEGGIFFNQFVYDAKNTDFGTRIFFDNLSTKDQTSELTGLSAFGISDSQHENDTLELWDSAKNDISGELFSDEYKWSGNLSDPIPVMATSNTKTIQSGLEEGDIIELNVNLHNDDSNVSNQNNFPVEFQIKTFAKTYLGTSFYLSQENLSEFIKKSGYWKLPVESNQNLNLDNWVTSNSLKPVETTYLPLIYDVTVPFPSSTSFEAIQDYLLDVFAQSFLSTSTSGTPMPGSYVDIPVIRNLLEFFSEQQSIITNLLALFTGVISLVLLLVITNVTIVENRRLIAIMHTQGYSDNSTNSIFVGMYIPLVLAGIGASIPLGYTVLEIISNVLLTKYAFSLPIIAIWWQILIVVIAVFFIFFICYFATWLSSRRIGYLRLVQSD